MTGNQIPHRYRAFLYLSALASVCLVAIGATAALLHLRSEDLLRARSDALHVARSVEMALEAAVDRIDHALQLTADEWTHAPVHGAQSVAERTRLLKRQQARLPLQAELRMANAQGAWHDGSGPEAASTPDLRERPVFLRLGTYADAGLVSFGPERDGPSQRWVWRFARRLTAADGAFAGVVVASVPLRELEAVLAAAHQNPGDSIILRNRELAAVAQFPVAPALRVVAGQAAASPAEATGDSWLTLRDALAQYGDSGSYDSTAEDGVPRLRAFQRSTRHGFMVDVGVSRHDVLADWRLQVWVIGSMVLLFTLLSLLYLRLVLGAWRRQANDLAALREREAQLNEAQGLAHVGSFSYDVLEGVWRSSPELDRMFGINASYRRDTESWLALIDAPQRDEMRAYLGAVVQQRLPFDREYAVRRFSDGRVVWVHGRGVFTHEGDEAPLVLNGSMQDITERRRVDEELRVAAAAFQSHEGMLVTDANSVILRVNSGFTAITGYSAEDVVGQTPRVLSSGQHDSLFYQAFWQSLKEHGFWKGEVWNRRKSGEIYPLVQSVSAVRGADGAVTHYVAVFNDISSLKAADDEIRNLAFFDPLTKLPNRRLLQDRLRQALAACARSGRHGALLVLDLDHFKSLNETLGHEKGDMLLRQVAQRLQASVREGDTAARLGGDEFVVLLEDLSENHLEAAAQAQNVGQKILTALSRVYLVEGHSHHSTTSVGVTLIGRQTVDADEPLKQADIALYQAKDGGRNTLCFFDPAVQANIAARVDLEQEMRDALANGQFELHFQIQANAKDVPHGAEALIRWKHPRRGQISPAQFIPAAEKSGQIVAIGEWVLDSACAQLKRWETHSHTRDLVLSINVSAQQFQQANFVQQVRQTLERHAIRPDRLRLELTESMLVGNVHAMIATIGELKALGVTFALDDFGTGYSSLQYLKRLPIDELKIDQSFVRDIAVDPSDRAIVHTIVLMAQALRLEVIAEGVETPQQRQILMELGCPYFQGYLLGRPQTEEAFNARVCST